WRCACRDGWAAGACNWMRACWRCCTASSPSSRSRCSSRARYSCRRGGGERRGASPPGRRGRAGGGPAAFRPGRPPPAGLQLLFGAAYRHFRDSHSLWTHAAFSMVVLILALLAGFAAGTVTGDYGGLGRTIRRCGVLLIVVVALQFALGWATFAMGGRQI